MKYFGTDGIRGKAGKDINNFLVAKLGQSLAVYIKEKSETDISPKVVIGRDTRISGAQYEDILSRALADFGVNVIVLGILPTPAIAFYIRHYNADAGVVISASHNPPQYNGLKIFNSKGYKFTENEEDKIETLMDMNFIKASQKKGKIDYPDDVLSVYSEFIINNVKPKLNNMKIYLDCSEGASYKLAPYIFGKLTNNLYVMADSGDGNKINIECGATAPEFLAARMKEANCDVGFSFDGDADRLIAVDRDGAIIDGDQLMYMHAVDMKERGGLYKDTVVGTVMSNLGFANALKHKGIKLIREAVGDKYVFDRMINKGYNIGGEQSGHIIFMDYQTTGDGILSAVLTANLLARTGKTLSELAADIKPYPQILSYVEADKDQKYKYEMDAELAGKINLLADELGECGRILVRPSGTEPKIRIMVEADTMELCKYYSEKINMYIREHIFEV